VEGLKRRQDTAATAARTAASPAPTIESITDVVCDARLKVSDANAMLQALQTAQEEADAALTEVQPRRRATNVKTKAKVARPHEAVALFHIVASLLFAHILVTVCLKTIFGHYCVYGRGRQGGCDAT
jgi:hypothetical protein